MLQSELPIRVLFYGKGWQSFCHTHRPGSQAASVSERLFEAGGVIKLTAPSVLSLGRALDASLDLTTLRRLVALSPALAPVSLSLNSSRLSRCTTALSGSRRDPSAFRPEAAQATPNRSDIADEASSPRSPLYHPVAMSGQKQ
jgi:hypothetical protein